MTNEELIGYLKESIENCDEFKRKYAETNHDLSKVFEGMAEAYVDIYEKLSGQKYISPMWTCCGNCANTSSNAYTEMTGNVWCNVGDNPHRKMQTDICSQYKKKEGDNK